MPTYIEMRKRESDLFVFPSYLLLDSQNRGDQETGRVVDDLCQCHHSEPHEEAHQATHTGDSIDNGGVLIHPDDLGERGAEEAGHQRRVFLGVSHQQAFELCEIKLCVVRSECLKVPSVCRDRNLNDLKDFGTSLPSFDTLRIILLQPLNECAKSFQGSETIISIALERCS